LEREQQRSRLQARVALTRENLARAQLELREPAVRRPRALLLQEPELGEPRSLTRLKLSSIVARLVALSALQVVRSRLQSASILVAPVWALLLGAVAQVLEQLLAAAQVLAELLELLSFEGPQLVT
jgi:hypothetical protein